MSRSLTRSSAARTTAADEFRLKEFSSKFLGYRKVCRAVVTIQLHFNIYQFWNIWSSFVILRFFLVETIISKEISKMERNSAIIREVFYSFCLELLPVHGLHGAATVSNQRNFALVIFENTNPRDLNCYRMGLNYPGSKLC